MSDRRHTGLRRIAWLRLVVYLGLVAVVVAGLWRSEQAIRLIREEATTAIVRECEERNDMRLLLRELIDTSLLPPRPVPEGASDELRLFIKASNERSERFRDEAFRRLTLIDCRERVEQTLGGS